MLTHFIHSPASLKQARNEFETVAREHYPCESTATDQTESKVHQDYLNKTVTLEVTQDLEHLNRVMCEALRFDCPAPLSSLYFLKEDAKLGKY